MNHQRMRHPKPVVKTGQSRQVVIPKRIWENFALQPGDYLEVEQEEDRIVFSPKRLVGKDELWYWSKRGQAETNQALKEVEQGKAKEFDNIEDLIKDLNS